MKDDQMRNAQLKPEYNVQDYDGRHTHRGSLHFYYGFGIWKRRDLWIPEAKKINTIHQATDLQKRSFKSDINKRKNMVYDAAVNIYICHVYIPTVQGTLHGVSVHPSASSVHAGVRTKSWTFILEGGCPYKETCTKAKGGYKRLYLSKN